MTTHQRTAFLFALAALIATSAFNGTFFIEQYSNQFSAAIEMNRMSLSHQVPPSHPDQSTSTATSSIPHHDTRIPTHVRASWQLSSTGTDQIKVTWHGEAGQDNGYTLFRKTDTESNYSVLKNVSSNVTTFYDKNIVVNTTYRYKVKTWTSGLSAASNGAQIGVLEGTSTPTIFGSIEQ